MDALLAAPARTRAFDIRCSGAPHRVVARDDGTVRALAHDPAAEAVAVALGGDPSPCSVYADALARAASSWAALAGRTAAPDGGFTAEYRWSSHDRRHPCCPAADFGRSRPTRASVADAWSRVPRELSHARTTRHLATAEGVLPEHLDRCRSLLAPLVEQRSQDWRDAASWLTGHHGAAFLWELGATTAFLRALRHAAGAGTTPLDAVDLWRANLTPDWLARIGAALDAVGPGDTGSRLGAIRGVQRLAPDVAEAYVLAGVARDAHRLAVRRVPADSAAEYARAARKAGSAVSVADWAAAGYSPALAIRCVRLGGASARPVGAHRVSDLRLTAPGASLDPARLLCAAAGGAVAAIRWADAGVADAEKVAALRAAGWQPARARRALERGAALPA